MSAIPPWSVYSFIEMFGHKNINLSNGDLSSVIFRGEHLNKSSRQFRCERLGNIGNCFADGIFKFIVNWFNFRWICQGSNYTNPGYGLSLVDTLWNAGSYRQPLEQEGNSMT